MRPLLPSCLVCSFLRDSEWSSSVGHSASGGVRAWINHSRFPVPLPYSHWQTSWCQLPFNSAVQLGLVWTLPGFRVGKDFRSTNIVFWGESRDSEIRRQKFNCLSSRKWLSLIMDIWGKYDNMVYLIALESNVKSLEERIHTRMLSLEEDKDFNGGSSRHFSCGCDKILNKINLRK